MLHVWWLFFHAEIAEFNFFFLLLFLCSVQSWYFFSLTFFYIAFSHQRRLAILPFYYELDSSCDIMWKFEMINYVCLWLVCALFTFTPCTIKLNGDRNFLQCHKNNSTSSCVIRKFPKYFRLIIQLRIKEEISACRKIQVMQYLRLLAIRWESNWMVKPELCTINK